MKKDYDILNAIDDIIIGIDNDDFKSKSNNKEDDDNFDLNSNVGMRAIKRIIGFKSEVLPPECMELFNECNDKVYDMRYFLTNMRGDNIYVIKLDTNDVYSHMNSEQHELYCSSFHKGSLPRNKGLYVAVSTNEGLNCSYKWKSITEDIKESFSNILYWLCFGNTNNIDISNYINGLSSDAKALLNVIIENKDKILNIMNAKEEY